MIKRIMTSMRVASIIGILVVLHLADALITAWAFSNLDYVVELNHTVDTAGS